MRRIALTGGIACGKSLVARFLNELGVETLDADDIVHELIPADERRRLAARVFADPAARKALEARIHPIVKERIGRFFDSSINRLIDCGQEDADNRPMPQSPNAIEKSKNRKIEKFRIAVVPLLCGQEDAGNRPMPQSPTAIEKSKNRKIEKFRVAVVPLLFEVHWEKEFDIILCVTSSRATQVARMMTTRGYTREEAEARLAAQLPVAEKAAKSHYVIDNDGSPEALRTEVEKMVEWLKVGG